MLFCDLPLIVIPHEQPRIEEFEQNIQVDGHYNGTFTIVVLITQLHSFG